MRREEKHPGGSDERFNHRGTVRFPSTLRLAADKARENHEARTARSTINTTCSQWLTPGRHAAADHQTATTATFFHRHPNSGAVRFLWHALTPSPGGMRPEQRWQPMLGSRWVETLHLQRWRRSRSSCLD